MSLVLVQMQWGKSLQKKKRMEKKKKRKKTLHGTVEQPLNQGITISQPTQHLFAITKSPKQYGLHLRPEKG